MSSYPVLGGFDIYEQQTLIVVYKDEMLLNQLKKLVESRRTDDGDSHIKIASWSEKIWQAHKSEGTIANRVLFLGDINGTASLIPVIDTKFNRHGVRYGWAGKQAVLYVEPKEISKFEDYEAFWSEMNLLPIPEKVKNGNKPINPQATNTLISEDPDTPTNDKQLNIFAQVKDSVVLQFDKIGKITQRLIEDASKASQDMFRNQSLVKQQMLFYGVFKLCESDLDSFMFFNR